MGVCEYASPGYHGAIVGGEADWDIVGLSALLLRDLLDDAAEPFVSANAAC